MIVYDSFKDVTQHIFLIHSISWYLLYSSVSFGKVFIKKVVDVIIAAAWLEMKVIAQVMVCNWTGVLYKDTKIFCFITFLQDI